VTQPFVIVGATRTPLGSFQGEFASLMAPQLGAHAIRAPVERSGLKPEAVEEVIMGGACCLPALQTNMFWHRRYNQNEASRWLRALVADSFAE
jgi:acetyl-CoA acetyltransferase